jgi:hypothetical protein
MNMGYDIIGDIHGHADELEGLLKKLGYHQKNSCYQHSERQVIFLGDFIDRGPKQTEVLQIVMPMVQNQHALAVMGNHEFNALAFHKKHPSKEGEWLRPRSNKNLQQHIRFLEEYLPRKDELNEVLEFFDTLPLWLDLDGIRVVHACWKPSQMQVLNGNSRLTSDLLIQANTQGTPEYAAIEELLKGVEYTLPEGKFFHDKDGNERNAVRVKWWINENCTLRDAAFQTNLLDENTVSIEMKAEDFLGYPENEKPVFFGHYWFQGTPSKLATNVACLDYSVARGGKLVAYQWDGEDEISDEKFVYV